MRRIELRVKSDTPDHLTKEETCTRDKSKAGNRRRRQVGGSPGEGASVPATKASEAPEAVL